MDETKLTIIRTVLKIAGAALVTHGVMSSADATAFQVAAESDRRRCRDDCRHLLVAPHGGRGRCREVNIGRPSVARFT
jgi:hypothetical protein